ncbi:MAG: multiubiquitin domain-containing protein [Acidobacteriota bacterium]
MEKVLVEIEEYVKNAREIPKEDVIYKFKVGSKTCESEFAVINGREILTKANLLPPEMYQLNQHLRGGNVVPVELDQQVDLSEHGIERFSYLRKDSTEG